MRSKRVPDRVHVVRPPENDGFVPPKDGASIEIVRMLAQISDKLKRSEAERYELLNELREYRKSLRELEDKADNSEKAYLAIENKIQAKGNVDTESLQRQARFEKILKATEDKMVKAIAGQALIDKRLSNTENKQTMIDQRLDQSVSEQTRLDRQLELTAQDKSRLIRKVERLEEIVTETQDTLRAKAMVLLTDQSAAAQAGLQAPAWGAGSPQHLIEDQAPKSWWQRVVNMQSAGMTAMIIAALLGGWTINQIQQPKIPQIAVLDNGTLARLNVEGNAWEPLVQERALLPETPIDMIEPSPLSDVNTLERQKLTERLDENTTPEAQAIPASMNDGAAEGAEGNVLDYSDDQLLAALNSNPEKLAAQLNDIEPSATEAGVRAQESAFGDLQITEPMKNFETVAYAQEPQIVEAVKAEQPTKPLSSRVSADNTLPNDVKPIERQALEGVPEAQHDLAAIYTAGQGGVTQNFEKAAFWFREASNNGIGNARYNLGVLYHQGLGQERDLSRALYWYREAARLNHAEAQYNLGIAHIEGIGTNYDPRLAAAFFERAANNGIMEAAYNLGLIYENGLLGTAKPDEALLWYKIAADQGSVDAEKAMEQLAQNLQIGMSDIDNLVERMQQINMSVKGRRAGPEGANQSSSNAASAVGSTQAMTAQVQEYLMLTGAYAGPADGINGAQTEKAIRAYQAANNMPVDGKVSRDLLNNMVGGAIEKLNM